MQCDINAYVIFWWYKSGCNLVLGSPFASPQDRELKHPTSQLSHHDPSPGPSRHPYSFQ